MASTATLTPSGTGALDQLTAYGAPTTWQAVLTNDGLTTYISNAVAGTNHSLFTVASPGILSGSTISDVTVYAMVEAVGGNGSTYKIYLDVYTGAVNYTSAGSLLTLSWALYSNTWTTNPHSGVAWTPADVNSGLQIGVGIPAVKFSIDVTQVYAIITYTPPSGSPTTCSQMVRLY